MDSSAVRSQPGATSAARRHGFALLIAAPGAWMLGSMLWSEAHPAGRPLLNASVSGLMLILLGMGAALRMRSWMRVGCVAIGLWMIEAPWILGFMGTSAPALNTVATGLVVILVVLTFPCRAPPCRPDTDPS